MVVAHSASAITVLLRRQEAEGRGQGAGGEKIFTNAQYPVTNHQSPVTNHPTLLINYVI
ncbi:MAG: hypothetical protein ACKO9I_04360 [Sphaerospermopsis kisseleviana]